MTSTTGRAGRREWMALAALALPLLLVSMDVSVLFFAIPAISADLGPSSTQLLWIFDIYAFVLAGLLITMGTLGDRIGRRRLLLIGSAAFGGASLVAAYASSPGMLIGARALLGIGGACLLPSTLSLIRSVFIDAGQRALALGIWSGVMVIGVSSGPVLSGVLLEYFWWGSVFLVNVPMMLLLLILVPLLLPEYKDPTPGPFDLTGCLLTLAAVLPAIYGIKELGAHGIAPVPVACVVAGAVAGRLFVRRQRSSATPMLDPELLGRRAFKGAIGFAMTANWAVVGFAIFTSQFLQSVRGMEALEAALWSLTPSIGVFIATGVATGIAQRVDHAYVISGAFVVSAAGFVLLTQVRSDSPLWMILVGAAGLASGIAAATPLLTGMVVASAPPERAGAASATLQTGQEFGGALGLAVLGTIGAGIYRDRAESSMPDGLPDRALDVAHETVAGATVVARQLPGDTGDAVLSAARDAFTDGMNAVALVAACVMLLAAALVPRLLRGIAPFPAEDVDEEAVPAEEPVFAETEDSEAAATADGAASAATRDVPTPS